MPAGPDTASAPMFPLHDDNPTERTPYVTVALISIGHLLEGGTWWAGRRIADELREGGPPPIRTASDGTVF